MQTYFNYSFRFQTSIFRKKYFRLLDYIVKGVATLNQLCQYRADVVWCQLPPLPVLLVAFIYKWVINPHVRIVADCHNAMIRPLWLKIPFCRYLLAKADVNLVHNEDVLQKAIELDIEPNNILVLEDRPAQLETNNKGQSTEFKSPWVLFPSSFSVDEPVEELVAAASFLQNVTFVLTGDPSRCHRLHDIKKFPENIVLTGFLPVEELDKLLCRADAVLGLTKYDGIQLSACNEAVGARSPIVLSNTETLKKLFYKGAVFVNSEKPEAIANGIVTAIENRERLASEVSELRNERLKNWEEQAEKVARRLA
jgi:glycosyltransferase involved in cell wall biosynthesis